MLFAAEVLARIRDGSLDLAFRRWKRPSVKAGTRLRTAAGIVEVLAVAPVAEADIDDETARRAGAADRAAPLRRLRAVPDGTLYRIVLRHAGEDPRIALRETLPDDLSEALARLQRLDAASRSGAWTRAVLSLIAANEGVRAADLAARLGWETKRFKADVRKLKELGFTESLDVGYRLSPRGRAVLAAIS